MSLPIPRIFVPVTIDATNNKILLRADVTGATVNGYVATLTSETHVTAASLADAARTAINAATDPGGTGYQAAGGTVTCAVSDAGLVSITLSALDSSSPVLYWYTPDAWSNNGGAGTVYAVGDFVTNDSGKVYRCDTAGTGSTTTGPTGVTADIADGTARWDYITTTTITQAVATLYGYSTAANDSAATSGGAVTFTADYQQPNIWSPGVPVAKDSERDLTSWVAVAETAGGQNRTTRWTASDTLNGRHERRQIAFAYLTPARVWTADATGADTNQAFESFWRGSGIGKFRYSPDRADPATGAADYYLREESARTALDRVERTSDSVELYRIELDMGAYQP